MVWGLLDNRKLGWVVEANTVYIIEYTSFLSMLDHIIIRFILYRIIDLSWKSHMHGRKIIELSVSFWYLCWWLLICTSIIFSAFQLSKNENSKEISSSSFLILPSRLKQKRGIMNQRNTRNKEHIKKNILC